MKPSIMARAASTEKPLKKCVLENAIEVIEEIEDMLDQE